MERANKRAIDDCAERIGLYPCFNQVSKAVRHKLVSQSILIRLSKGAKVSSKNGKPNFSLILSGTFSIKVGKILK